MRLGSWEEPDPAEIIRLAGDSDWKGLADRFSGVNDKPLARCLEVARLGGANTLVIETRYLDLDYRSEFSAFYSRIFMPPPDSAVRLHFFRGILSPAQLVDLPEDHGYLGYMVLRPSEPGQVGRTMLPPPPGLEAAIRTCVSDKVTFFGQELPVLAAPFCQQDTQVGRCAHAAAWMCHYSAYCRGEVGRRTVADFRLASEPWFSPGRLLPSEGLTDQQIMDVLRGFGLPPIYYSMHDLPSNGDDSWVPPDPVPQADAHPGTWDYRCIRVICRFLNSGLPVLVANRDHTFVLTGYRRRPMRGRKPKPDWIDFFRHDDQQGPYLKVGNVLDDWTEDGEYQYSPWEALIAPVPEKIWLKPEIAELFAGPAMVAAATRSVSSGTGSGGVLLEAIAADAFALRSYVVAANSFKALAPTRLDPTLAREYRLARLPRYVWVVEAVDRRLRKKSVPCVLGEAIFDATSDDATHRLLAVHVPGVATVQSTTGRSFTVVCSPQPYVTGGAGVA